MPGPFVSEDRFEIVVKYMEKQLPYGGTSCVVVNSKEMEEKYGALVKEIHTQWVQPNWQETNDLIRKSTVPDPYTGRRDMDWTLYRQFLLERYMKSWDITQEGPDGKSVQVPCTVEYINKLDPSVAAALVEEFVRRTTISEDDLKN